MQDDIEVILRNPFLRHGEELVRSRYAPEVRERPLIWPQIGMSIEDFRDREVIVAKVGGVVAGRAILDAVYYPFAELENLEVIPAFRGRGVGRQIVAEGIKRAADMGFLALHVQTDLENLAAHRLYAGYGFLPAQKGRMLKLVRFLNYPALFHFLWEHPLALFQTGPAESSDLPVWRLSWTDPLDSQNLSIGLRGGSCQADSDGFGPAVSLFQVRSSHTCLETSVAAPHIVSKGQSFDMELEITNLGSTDLEGTCRLLLNPGFRPASETPGSAKFYVRPSSSEKLILAVEVLDSFNDEVLKICAYRSVSIAVEVFVGDYIFWLSSQLKVQEAG